ncbi:MAG: hypothetical protein JNJ44_06465 [Zoogloeaceae bacterium]|nr:hypothetical protein [Zoogloeaceae bacterium]
MSHMVEISDETYKKLQALAVPFVDTPDSVIRRAVDKMMNASTRDGEGPPAAHTAKSSPDCVHGDPRSSVLSNDKVMTFEPTSLPDVTHTTFLAGVVASTEVQDWNHLSLAVHAEVFRKVGSVEALRRASTANIKPGSHFDHGFKTGKGLPFSIQGAEANKACSIAFRLAREHGIAVTAEFRWQNKEKAAFPGSVGRIESIPKKS